MAPHKSFNLQQKIRIICLVVYDVMAIAVAQVLALITRFDFTISHVTPHYLDNCFKMMLINIIVTILIFIIMHLYSSLWEYASEQEMINVGIATLCSSALHATEFVLFQRGMPRSYYVLYMFYITTFIVVSRFAYRGARVIKRTIADNNVSDIIPTLIIGAGDSAYALIKDILNSQTIKNKVVCVIDANPNKIGKKILSVPIVGDDTNIIWAVEKYSISEIFIAIPRLKADRKREILEICKNTGCKLRILPSMEQIVNEEITVSNLRDVSIEDLLGRDPVETNLSEIMGYIYRKCVLVTGGGGSIGSELCRQIAKYKPGKLIIFDIYENTTYNLQLELKDKYPGLDMEVLIGSVRDEAKVEDLFRAYKPEIVFHAAAHKHVPLMEDSPAEAIKNNVFGTYNVARIADLYRTERMVLISTDKAVNPTNIMGASKRICEMVIQSMARISKNTSYVAVRFGNVLGSNGSVIPIFKKQIENGGPVTVTHKDIIRYFMTIPEAVALVLQAGAYAKGGEIFILDMGDPVRIDDMARNLIKLSGYEPDVDIPIIYSGLRPGEKLFEECLKEEEGLAKTDNQLIFIAKPLEFNEEGFFEKLDELKDAANKNVDDIKKRVHEIIPSYQLNES